MPLLLLPQSPFRSVWITTLSRPTPNEKEHNKTIVFPDGRVEGGGEGSSCRILINKMHN